MPDEGGFSNGRKELLERLRAEAPEGTDLVCGYPGEGPPGYVRVFGFRGTIHFDVPENAIRERHTVPPAQPGSGLGTVLIVDAGLDLKVTRTQPADLLVGPIHRQLPRLAEASICYVWWTRTWRPNHYPGSPLLDLD